MKICNIGYCKSVSDDYLGVYDDGEKCPACEAIIKKAKEWFGDGEYDVDAMIKSGLVTEKFAVDCYRLQVLKESF